MVIHELDKMHNDAMDIAHDAYAKKSKNEEATALFRKALRLELEVLLQKINTNSQEETAILHLAKSVIALSCHSRMYTIGFYVLQLLVAYNIPDQLQEVLDELKAVLLQEMPIVPTMKEAPLKYLHRMAYYSSKYFNRKSTALRKRRKRFKKQYTEKRNHQSGNPVLNYRSKGNV